MFEQFRTFCDKKNISKHLIILYTLQQNSVAERKHRTLLDMVWSMMAQANLPISYWRNIFLTVAYILNHVPSKTVPSNRYELLNDERVNIDNLHPGGCVANIYTSSHPNVKLGRKGKKYIFIRYSTLSKGSVFMSEEATRRVIEIES